MSGMLAVELGVLEQVCVVRTAGEAKVVEHGGMEAKRALEASAAACARLTSSRNDAVHVASEQAGLVIT